MVDTDLSFWGIWTMPIGVAICFGPALLYWLKMELKAEAEQQKQPARAKK